MAGMTPGDPLGGDAGRQGPERPREPASPPTRPEAPDASSPYGSGRVPPGALTWERPSRADVASRRPAGYGRRVVATLIDLAIIGIVAALLIAAAGATLGIFDNDATGIIGFVVTLLFVVIAVTLVALLYAPVLMARTNGQTLGKMAMGIRVVRADGRRVDFLWAALREAVVKGLVLGFAASLTGGLAYLADVLWPLVDKQDRALHDFMVDSRVVGD